MIATTAALWGSGPIWHLISYISLSPSGFADSAGSTMPRGCGATARRLTGRPPRPGSSSRPVRACTSPPTSTRRTSRCCSCPLTWVGVEQAYAIWLGDHLLLPGVRRANDCRRLALPADAAGAGPWRRLRLRQHTNAGLRRHRQPDRAARAPMTWTWREWRLGRGQRAAIGIGIAWSAKLFLPCPARALPRDQAPVACRRRRRDVTGMGLFAIGLAVFGWAEQVSWTRAIAGIEWPWLAQNSSIVAPFTRAVYAAAGGSTPANCHGNPGWPGCRDRSGHSRGCSLPRKTTTATAASSRSS